MYYTCECLLPGILVSEKGLNHLYDLAYRSCIVAKQVFGDNYGARNLPTSIQPSRQLLQENPYSPEPFKNAKYFRADQGYFKTYTKLHDRREDFKFGEITFTLYRRVESVSDDNYDFYKRCLPIIISLLRAAKVEYVIHRLAIGLMTMDQLKRRGKKPNTGIYTRTTDVGAPGFEALLLPNEVPIDLLKEFPPEMIKRIHQRLTTQTFGNVVLNLNEIDRIVVHLLNTLHELGHRTDFACMFHDRDMINDLWARDKSPVTKVALPNPQEWFAEHFAAWVTDGLAYDSKKQKPFESLLGLSKNESKASWYDANVKNINDLVKSALASAAVNKGDFVGIKFDYPSGPNVEVQGRFLDFNSLPVPGIVYEHIEMGKNYGRRILNIFPDRLPKIKITKTT